ncbi:MAG: peptidoglycan DD-metalloendopeptidase family protein [Leptolyngbyaceae bacterium]|nr:peptidoglycan DD-metalloendopeptidase family protein [Leptolyngbyaceae bacterium]
MDCDQIATSPTQQHGWISKALPWLKRYLLSCFLAIILIFIGSCPVQAASLESIYSLISLGSQPPILLTTQTIEDLKRQQQQIQEQRASVLRERDRLRNLEQAAQSNLRGLQVAIASTTIQIKDYEYQLDLAKRYLKELQLQLVQAESNYQQRQFSTVARLRFLQRQQGSQGWAVLLQSQNFNQFLDRRHQLKLVYQADRQILEELKAEAEEIQRQKLQVEKQRNQIALLTQQLLAKKAEYQAQAQSQQQLINRLRTDRTALEAAEAQLARDSQDLGALIQQRVAEQRAKEAAEAAARARNRNSSPSVVVRGTGQMSYPSDGPITSGFGWRTHPILGTQRFHAGVDFGADHGSAIRAADTGIVIVAGWYGGYGYAVVIDHGNGITTLYGHASALYVSEGQAVQRGQAIAAIGSTGLSTGPHLHFEVRQDGEPVDPMGYL